MIVATYCKETFSSGIRAKRAMAQRKAEDYRAMRFDSTEFRITARFCMLRRSGQLNGEPTGGMLLTVTVTDPSFMLDGVDRGAKFRVRAGFTQKTLSYALARAERFGRRGAALRGYRAGVEDSLSLKKVPGHKRLEKYGLPTLYSKMSIEDCQAWLTIVAGWPNKPRFGLLARDPVTGDLLSHPEACVTSDIVTNILALAALAPAK